VSLPSSSLSLPRLRFFLELILLVLSQSIFTCLCLLSVQRKEKCTYTGE
jgi:hypothetical protein